MSTNNTFVGPNGGDFATAANWSSSQTPGTADTAVINTTTALTVTLSTTDTIGGVNIGPADTLGILSGGSLDVTEANGQLPGNAGEIALGDGGTLTLGGTGFTNTGNVFVSSTTAEAALLIAGSLDLSGGGNVGLLGGLLAASVDGASLTNTNTIIGYGTIGNGTTLAIDNLSTIDAKAGTLILQNGGVLTNEGVIGNADTSGVLVVAAEIDNTAAGTNNAGTIDGRQGTLTLRNALVYGGTLLGTIGVAGADLEATAQSIHTSALIAVASATTLLLHGTIDQTSTLAQVGGGTIDAGSGTVSLSSANVIGGTLESSGGGKFVVSGTSLTSYLNGALVNTGDVVISNSDVLGLSTAATNKGTIEIAGVLSGEGTSDAVTLSGGGTILLEGTSVAGGLSNGGDLNGYTIDNVDHLIKGIGVLGLIADTLTNGGTIDADGSGTLTVGGVIQNDTAGLLEATNGGVLNDTGGTIDLASKAEAFAAATILFAGVSSTPGNAGASQPGTLTNSSTILASGSSADVAIGMVVQNANGTIEADSGTITIGDGASSQTLGFAGQAGTIVGGTLTSTNGGTIAAYLGTLSDVTNQGYVAVQNELGLSGTILNAGLLGVNAADVMFAANVAAATLNGAGLVVLAGGTMDGSSTGLVNAANTISGNGLIEGAVTNDATILGNDTGALQFQAYGTSDFVVNAGLIQATSAAGVVVASVVQQAATSGTIDADGGTVSIGSTATLHNAGTVQGGTLESYGIGEIAIIGAAATLDGTGGLTNEAVVAAGTGDTLTLLGAIDNVGSVASGVRAVAGTLSAAGGVLFAGNALALSGGGSVQLAGGTITGGSYRLNNLDNTISGSGLIDAGTLAIANAGTVDATTGTLTLNAGGGGFTNTGIAEATSGTLLITGSLDNTHGTISASQGAVDVQGTVTGGTIIGSAGALNLANATVTGATIDVTGGTLTLNDSSAKNDFILAQGAQVVFSGATLSGGTIDQSGTGSVQQNAASTLDGSAAPVGIGVTLAVPSYQAITLLGSVANSGRIVMGTPYPLNGFYGQGTLLVGGPTLSLSGGGTVDMTNYSGGEIIGAASSDLLDNIDNTIVGGGEFGNGSLEITNGAKGTIEGNGPHSQLTLLTDGSAIGNAGLIEATGGGGLGLDSNVTQQAGGTILASGANVQVDGITIAGGTLMTANGSFITLSGTSESGLDGTTVPVVNDGTMQIGAGQTLLTVGTLAGTGEIATSDYYSPGTIQVGAAGMTLASGTLDMTNRGGGAITGATTGARLENQGVIQGGGILGGGTLTLVNDAQGTIQASGWGFVPLTIDTGSIAVQNAGVIATTNTNQLVLTGSIAQAAGGTILAAGANVVLAGATISGGTVENGPSSTAAVTLSGSGGNELDGTAAPLIDAATIDLGAGQALTIAGEITHDGTIQTTDYYNQGTVAVAASGVTLAGSGTIAFANRGHGEITGAAGATLDNAGNSIVGAGTVDTVTLINGAGGTLNANSVWGALVLSSGVANAGMIEASANSVAVNGGMLANSGTVWANGAGVSVGASAAVAGLAAGTLSQGAWLATGATIAIAAGSIGVLATQVSLTSGGALTGGGTDLAQSLGTIAAGGTLAIAAQTLGAQAPTLVDDGALVLGSAGTLSVANLAVDGGGTLALSGGTVAAAPVTIGTTGLVIGNGSIGGPMMLDGQATASGGTLALGGTVTGTGTLRIATGATLDLGAGISGATVAFDPAGNATLMLAAPGSVQGTIAQFGTGDTISLAGFSGATETVQTVGTTTEVAFQQSGAPVGTLDLLGAYSAASLTFDSTTATLTTSQEIPCFRSGTRIATETGTTSVERLRVGQHVRLADGTTAAIVWLGHRRVNCRRHLRSHDVLPIRVRHDAFGPNLPSRDLFLSPDHAVLVEGVLIPVRYLLNGATILQERVSALTYWHVELERHGILLAEGLPCESYLDTGNRAAFANGGIVVQAAPDFARAVWQAQGCAPLVSEGEVLAAARRRLVDRAMELGHTLIHDPDLHLRADGRIVQPVSAQGGRYRFTLRRPAKILRLCSRSGVPAEVDPAGADARRLGVMVTRLAVHCGGDWREIALDTLAEGDGWHRLERDGTACWRWTDGDARLPLDDTDRGGALLLLEADIQMTMSSWRKMAHRHNAIEAVRGRSQLSSAGK